MAAHSPALRKCKRGFTLFFLSSELFRSLSCCCSLRLDEALNYFSKLSRETLGFINGGLICLSSVQLECLGSSTRVSTLLVGGIKYGEPRGLPRKKPCASAARRAGSAHFRGSSCSYSPACVLYDEVIALSLDTLKHASSAS